MTTQELFSMIERLKTNLSFSYNETHKEWESEDLKIFNSEAQEELKHPTRRKVQLPRSENLSDEEWSNLMSGIGVNN